jgi:hypothetical protein
MITWAKTLWAIKRLTSRPAYEGLAIFLNNKEIQKHLYRRPLTATFELAGIPSAQLLQSDKRRVLNMHKSVFAFALLVATATSGVALAADNWKKSFYGGRYEFFADNGDLRLYISCPTADSSPDAMSSVRLTRLSTNRDIGVFKLVANGHTYDGPIETASVVGSGNFKDLMKNIRTNGATVKYALGNVSFNKDGAAKFFPAVNNSFPCQTNW